MNPFDFGFEHAWRRDHEVLGQLTEEQYRRYFPDSLTSRFLVHEYCKDPSDALWDDANNQNPTAISILGVLARRESNSIERVNELGEYFFEAIPGYTDDYYHNDPSPTEEEQIITVEEFEIGCLQTEIKLYKMRAARTREQIIESTN